MKICMVPDANICVLKNSVHSLSVRGAMLGGMTKDQSFRLHQINRIITDIATGRIDCQTPVRANRSVLEIVNESASLISENSDDYETCEQAEMIVAHTQPHILDKWETK